MKEVTLEAQIREQRGKQVKRLRREGKIPGVYYLHGEPSLSIVLTELALQPLQKSSETHLIRLKTSDGAEHRCILREIVYDPVTDRPVHFDLQGFRADEKIRVEVPIVLKGTAAGQRDGGLVQHILHRLRVECLPDSIPEHVEINIEGLGINHSVHVRDLALENATILDNPNSAIVAVIPPTIEKVETPEEKAAAAAAATAEPEVIKKGKEEKEEDSEETKK
ncbi:MAG TPA: 50S ribosomal protein L25 [Candidatus Kapabacteria bacterium]|nr:50S ribosomal protein L25 [Candidatus Kapabacteria bacterium]